MRRTKKARTKGFTLLEMIIVLTVLSLVFILVGVGRTPHSPITEAKAAAREISEALRSARSHAISQNRSCAVTLDVANHRYRLDGEAPHPLPTDISLKLLTSRDLTASGSVGEIRFDPDGGSSGGRVSIAAAGTTWWIGVDWLSGRVSTSKKTG